MQQKTQQKWHILHVKQGKEEKTKELITEAFQKAKIETSLGRMRTLFAQDRVQKKGKFQVKKKFFGYLFVEVNLDAPKVRETLLDVENVRRFMVPPGQQGEGEEEPLSQEEIARMFASEERAQEITESVAKQFHVGDEVSIVAGAFKGRKGIVHRLDSANKKVEVVIEFFRQDTISSFNYNEIQ